MARIRQQAGMKEDDLLELLQLAGAARQASQPPPMDDLLKLLGIATTLHRNDQEQAQAAQELAIRQQAVNVQAEQAAIERAKLSQIDPQTLGFLLAGAGPEEARQLKNRAAGGEIFAGQPVEAPQQILPKLGQKGEPGTKSRLQMKSEKAYMGYQPPEGNVEAVVDESGKITNFVRAGTTEPVTGDFVPSAESVGMLPSFGYAVNQRLGALGRYLGILPQQQQALPY